MKPHIIPLSLIILASAATVNAQQRDYGDVFYTEPIIEEFNGTASDYFSIPRDFRHFSDMPSFTEKSDDHVLIMRIDPEGPAGAGRGPEIATKKRTHFGTYSARIRVPDVKKVQPNIGSVVGYFTYRMDPEFGLSEIDFEWLIADPRLIYIGTWTGYNDPGLNRIGRIINLATGEIWNTIYRSADGIDHPILVGTEPTTIEPIEGYDASKRFYEYGFDWQPDRLTWWVINPDTNEKIILWDYQGTEVFPGVPANTGVPVSPTTYLLNFWHTNNWPVDTNPNSIEKPAYPYTLEVDWMKYVPDVEASKKWIEENGWDY